MYNIKMFADVDNPQVLQLGGKGYSIIVLRQHGFNVPEGFTIGTGVFSSFVEHNSLSELYNRLAVGLGENDLEERSEDLREAILNAKLSTDVVQEVEDRLGKLSAGSLAVRSSAVGEDSLGASFAGLHDTFLNIPVEIDAVIDSIKRCWASAFNNRALIYRKVKGVSSFDGMAVVVQEMIAAEVSGVTFTVSPANNQCLLIESAYGLGNLIVGGDVD